MLITSFILVLFSGGCKDKDELGLVLLPSKDHLNTDFSDTATIISTTQKDDTLRTDDLSIQLLGSDYDAVFGGSTANIYSQLNLVGTPSFGTLPIADSLILSLAYAGYYGDTTGIQTFNVYELNEDLHIDSSYNSDKVFLYKPGTIGSLTAAPIPHTRPHIGNDSVPQIRIPLSLTLADSILALNGQSQLSSNAAWLTYFKGIYLEALPVNYHGAISYFDFFNSYMILYFHETGDTIGKKYLFSCDGARVNNFSHSYTSTPVEMQIQDPNYGDSVNYLQAMAGVKTKISFPFLKHFLDSGSILINRAELTITASSADLPYYNPLSLLMTTRNESGTLVFPVDYYESSDYFGGSLNTTTNTYTFNLARHLQRYLNGTVTNADFYIIISGSGIEATRAIIKSGKNQNTKMKLSLFYTKLY